MKKVPFAILAIFLSPAFLAAQGYTDIAIQDSLNVLPVSGRTLNLSETIEKLDADLYWDSFFQSGALIHNGHRASFRVGMRGLEDFVLCDGRELLPLPVPFSENGNLYFPEEFVIAIKRVFEKPAQEEESRFRIAAIVVDPGHGGKDTGASGQHTINGEKVNLVEKDIALTVSKELYKQLKAGFPDKRILITRESDIYPTLEDRVLRANEVPLKESEAVIYLSIHANASFNKKARGFEVWYLDPEHKREVIDKTKYKDQEEIIPILNDMLAEEYDRESIEMAKAIARRFSETFGKALPYRGLKAEEWFVVRKARMPSVLIELGFITNQEDAALMLSEKDLKKFSDSIYKGVMDFVTNFEESGGFITFQ
ncbi:MAG: N-acetylmuramoyl-L-alanine amidase [Spirochaetaceae bacterium]|jgi:N-acetylmuramoyl-L-alanine amidase|nr:N-acetylmuramoyl-L-alanine amidase [Spirochaetaceae bacterium]